MFGIGQFLFACLMALILYFRDEYDKNKCISNREFKNKYHGLVEELYLKEAESWKGNVVNAELEAAVNEKLKDRAVFITYKKYIIEKMGDRGRLLMERTDAVKLVKRLILAINGCVSEDEIINHILVNPHNEAVPEYMESLMFFNTWCSQLVENKSGGIHIEFVPSEKYLDNEVNSVYVTSVPVDNFLGVKNPKCGIFYWTKEKLDKIMDQAFNRAS